MNRVIHRRRVLHAGLALGASLALPSARACEFFTTSLRVTHPWTRATAADATSAVVCMTFDEVTRTDRLIAAATPVATGAEMGGALAHPGVHFVIAKGQASFLSEGGTYLRLVGLTQPLELGRSYPLTLVFEQGGMVRADLSVDYAALA